MDPPPLVVLFDLDGTISDSGRGIVNGIKHAFEVIDLCVPDDEDWGRYLGPPLRDALVDFHDLSADQVDVAIDAYLDYYRHGGMYENEVFAGIPELIVDLRVGGTTLAVATSKRAFMAEGILEYFGLRQHFAVVGGAHPDGTGGRKRDVIARTLDELASNRVSAIAGSGVVMVGDRRHDIEGAKQMGLATIGVGWGYAEPGELEAAGADVVVETVAELHELLCAETDVVRPP